jgi:hypothetical protein
LKFLKYNFLPHFWHNFPCQFTKISFYFLYNLYNIIVFANLDFSMTELWKKTREHLCFSNFAAFAYTVYSTVIGPIRVLLFPPAIWLDEIRWKGFRQFHVEWKHISVHKIPINSCVQQTFIPPFSPCLPLKEPEFAPIFIEIPRSELYLRRHWIAVMVSFSFVVKKSWFLVESGCNDFCPLLPQNGSIKPSFIFRVFQDRRKKKVCLHVRRVKEQERPVKTLEIYENLECKYHFFRISILVNEYKKIKNACNSKSLFLNFIFIFFYWSLI